MLVAEVVAVIGWAPAVLLFLGLLVFTFYLLAIVCDEALAPTLEELSDAWKIPHDVACATFLAAGSSAPEIAISIMSVLHGRKNSVDISMGALMGSALIAYTVIPAVCILVSPNQELKLDLVPLARDIIFYCAGLIVVVMAAQDGSIGLVESSLLVAMFFLYLVAMKVLVPFYNHDDSEHHFLTSNGESKPLSKYGAVDEEKQPEPNGQSKYEEDEEPTRIGKALRKIIPPFHYNEVDIREKYFFIMAVSIFYISVLSELCLLFAEALSDLMGVPHHFTGLVLVALGAQIPDTVASMAVARQGEGPSSIANAIGSQVLNINVGLGLPFLLSNIIRGSPMVLAPSDNSGMMIFFAIIVFLMLVMLERVVLKFRDAVVLGIMYGVIITGYYFHSSVLWFVGAS